MDLSSIKKVHIIGIGGIGVSAVARMFFEEGKIVTGNDIGDFYITQELGKLGIPVHIGVEHECIPDDAELIVYSRGWDSINPDFLSYAKSLGKPILSYPETLKIISAQKYTIAISGAHGKTTTTAMIGTVLLDAKQDPTIVVGSIMAKTKSNFVAGKSKYFVVEADEYRRSFLNLFPSILVITNIDADHLDYYKDIEDIKDAFNELASRVPQDGYIVCNPNSPYVQDVLKNTSASVIDYTKYLARCVHIKGEYNRNNAACAFAVASVLKLNEQEVQNSLEGFQGTWRRFEFKGTTSSGAHIYDDYGHHPTEVNAALTSAREQFPDKEIKVLFQPHLYSRTKNHLDEFADALSRNVNQSLILPIYAARESHDESITSDMLVDLINQKGGNAKLVSKESILKEELNSNTIFITMGAGDVYQIGESLL
jgi:UDP-N-acetylmuramate--alanine ligase